MIKKFRRIGTIFVRCVGCQTKRELAASISPSPSKQRSDKTQWYISLNRGVPKLLQHFFTTISSRVFLPTTLLSFTQLRFRWSLGLRLNWFKSYGTNEKQAKMQKTQHVLNRFFFANRKKPKMQVFICVFCHNF